MSTYRRASELSRFNAHGAGKPFAAVAPKRWRCSRSRSEVSAATGGAFDVTVAPAVDAWGFGPRSRAGARGSADASARRRARRDRLARSRSTPPPARWSRHAQGVRADLSGIAKGYGVDLAARALDALGSATTWSRPAARSRRAAATPTAAVADRHRARRTPCRSGRTSSCRCSDLRDGHLRRLPHLLRAGRAPLLATRSTRPRASRCATGSPRSPSSRRTAARRRDGHRAVRGGDRARARAGDRARARRAIHRARRADGRFAER